MAGLLSAMQSLWRADHRSTSPSRQSADLSSPWSPSSPFSNQTAPLSASAAGHYAAGGIVPPGSPMLSTATHPGKSHSAYSQAYPQLRSTIQRLKSALHAVVPETLDTLGSPLTIPAFNALQSALRCTLPQDVKDYLLCMDGQDVYAASGANLGALWGQLWLMSAEEIVAEWQLLRRMEERQSRGLRVVDDPWAEYAAPVDGYPDSCPPGWVRRQFSHPAWIPLARDDSGNYIGIDLDPPTLGDGRSDYLNSSQTSLASSRSSLSQHGPVQRDGAAPQPGSGQVIAFGRDITGKVVLFPGWASSGGTGGWARFLASVVDDLESGDFASLGVLNNGPRRSYDVSNNGDEGGPRSAVSSASAWSERDESDGIGELGYFEQHEADQESDEDEQMGSSSHRGAADFRKQGRSRRGARHWKLEPRWRGLGFVEALCERSKRRWRQLGMAPAPKKRRQPQPVLSSSTTTRSSQDQSRPAPASSSSVLLAQAESPEDAARTSAEADRPTSPNLVLSPASPALSDGLPLPPDDEHATPRPASSASVQQQQQQQDAPTPQKKRSAPPAPAAISIPTFDDLLGDAAFDSPASPSTSMQRHTAVTIG